MSLRKLVVLMLCLLGVGVVESKKSNHKDKMEKEHTTIKPFIKPFFPEAEMPWKRDGKEPTTIKPFFPDAEMPWKRNDNLDTSINQSWCLLIPQSKCDEEMIRKRCPARCNKGDGGIIPSANPTISPIFFGQNSSGYPGAGVRLLTLDHFVLPMVTPLEARVNKDHLPQVLSMVDSPAKVQNKKNSPLSKDLQRNKHTARPLMCGEYFITPGEKISIMTPYFPVKYPNNFRCRWNLQTEIDATFVVNCSFFKLAKGDSLSTYEIGKVSSLNKFQWSSGPTNYHMENYFIRLIFVSDKKQNNNGFSCQITAKPNEVEGLTTTVEPTTEVITTPKPEPTHTVKTAKPPTPAPTQPPLSDPECGIVNRAVNRIVNGQFADLHEYPWMAYLEIVWDDGHNQLCGGSLVFDQWVLTAAHCVLRKRGDGSQWMPEVKVTLAMSQRSKPSSGGAFTVTATDIEIHPKLSFSHDLTLIKLPSAVSYSDAVRPVCLPNRYMHGRNYTGMVMALSGWGKTEKGVISDKLRELGRYGIESAVCQKVFGQYITEHHFCTSGVDVKHICLGDSGGPVMTVEEDNRFFLTGVVSFVATKDCLGEFPDGHTSVTHFLDWIQTATGKAIN